jgi:AcrR family transcriptional regulator
VTHFRQDSLDRRVQRTRKLLQEALIELTIWKGFAAVTVRDITEYAEVNRATFYRHYQDKFDLLDQYAQEVYQLLDAPAEAEASTWNETRSWAQPTAGLVKMFEHVRAHARFYRVMLGENGDPAFVSKIQHYVEKRLRQFLPDALLREKALAELYLSYVSSASVGIILWWLGHELPYSPAEMAAVCVRLSAADLGAVMGEVDLSQMGS